MTLRFNDSLRGLTELNKAAFLWTTGYYSEQIHIKTDTQYMESGGESGGYQAQASSYLLLVESAGNAQFFQQ